ncbi:MAG: ATP:cob(I)alamin adenosyltransferase [Candidatus Yanofskybacteria bacterium RIFCSPHIGHO2_01_FULL_39_44]|nr:MAG: ATP:cob(I)alamin adenosyltransferase [Candidatus Yanofskybacteria bacterium RIFCSPHIGHO2_01_FULL_39_44]
MSNFYTRRGDKGKSYVGKKSVSKTCLEIEALGQLDELNSILGVLKTKKIHKQLQKIIHQVQENLFTIQSHVAAIMLDSKFKVPEFKVHKVEEIEKIIDEIESSLPPLKKFVISGSNQTSAWLDLLRAKSRNVERSVLKIKKINKLNRDIKAYLNRLSSLFFALARQEARNKKEHSPSYK